MVSKAQIQATKKYDKKTYERLNIRFRKDAILTAEYVREHTHKTKETLNGFILRAINETMERDIKHGSN